MPLPGNSAGSPEARGLATRVYFNASYFAAKTKKCAEMMSYGEKAAKFDDPAAQIPNSSWFQTVKQFKDCNDPNLQNTFLPQVKAK